MCGRRGVAEYLITRTLSAPVLFRIRSPELTPRKQFGGASSAERISSGRIDLPLTNAVVCQSWCTSQQRVIRVSALSLDGSTVTSREVDGMRVGLTRWAGWCWAGAWRVCLGRTCGTRRTAVCKSLPSDCSRSVGTQPAPPGPPHVSHHHRVSAHVASVNSRGRALGRYQEGASALFVHLVYL